MDILCSLFHNNMWISLELEKERTTLGHSLFIPLSQLCHPGDILAPVIVNIISTHFFRTDGRTDGHEV